MSEGKGEVREERVKKGKADHARMGVGRVLISLTLAMSP